MFQVDYWIIWHIYCVSFLLSICIYYTVTTGSKRIRFNIIRFNCYQLKRFINSKANVYSFFFIWICNFNLITFCNAWIHITRHAIYTGFVLYNLPVVGNFLNKGKHIYKQLYFEIRKGKSSFGIWLSFLVKIKLIWWLVSKITMDCNFVSTTSDLTTCVFILECRPSCVIQFMLR